MGNQPINETNISITNQQRDDWVKIEDQGYCQLWANKRTNKRFQAYPISDATAKDNVQIEKYAFRKIHNTYLVSAEAVISQNQTFLCSVPTTSFVLIQNIVNRLKSFPNTFTFEEALYILSSSASGYNTLCSFFGPLEPNEDMICFNEAGNVKVWLNENLSKNEASPNTKIVEVQILKIDDYSFAKRRSRECVQKLLNIVQASTIQGFPKVFKDETKKLSTFFEISNFVDYFGALNRINIPDHINIKRQQTFVSSGINQTTVNVAAPIQVPVRVQAVPSLQSSRVNQVFQPNYQRQLIPSNSVQQTQIPPQIGSVQYRTQVLPPPPVNVQRIQNQQVTYVYPPQPTVINSPPIIISQSVVPLTTVPQPIVQVNTVSIIKPQNQEQTHEIVKQNEAEKVKQQIIQEVIVEPQIQKIPSIVSTPEQRHEIFLPQQGTLNKNSAEEQQQQQPRFYQEELPQSSHYEQTNRVNRTQDRVDYQSANKRDYQVEVIKKVDEANIQSFKPEETSHFNYEKVIYQSENSIPQPKSIQHVNHSQQNIYKQQHEEQIQREEHQPNNESVYSQIQQYLPPRPQQELYVHSIEEKKEEYIISPQKQNEIDEWSQRLDQFTNSKDKKYQPTIQISQKEIKTTTVVKQEPQSFKNLIVSDRKEEYVNQLADLGHDDIQKYIRMKYQSYLNEQTQPKSQQSDLYFAKQPDPQPYRPKYQSTRTDSFQQRLQNATSNDDYKPSSYQYKYQQKYQNYNNYEKQNDPVEYQEAYQPEIYPLSNTNRISIQKEFQQDYISSRRNQSSKYGYKQEYDSQENAYNQYNREYPINSRQPERRSSHRNSKIIDEKYSKYVLNSQKPKRPTYTIASEDVSLILPTQESNFIKQTPRPILQKSYDHDSFSHVKSVANKGITYEKLRNLLWEQ